MDWFEQRASAPSLRRRGLEIGPGLMLRSSEQPDGNWAAWVEQEGRPLETEAGKPRLFLGASSYGAQCEAMRWLRSKGLTPAPATRFGGVARRGGSTVSA